MIYTKTGDKGTTSLANGERVDKTDARIEAYGTVDELNSWIGLLRAGISANGQQPTANSQLEWIQNKLFNLGACLATEKEKQHFVNDLQLTEEDVAAWITESRREETDE